MVYKFGYTCGTCGHTRTLVFDADKEGRPPAPYDVPTKLDCTAEYCEGKMWRTHND